jgi:glycerol-3-phosphate dehydrogenase
MYDFIIIGAGIVGTNIARELSKYPFKTLVLEKENDVANHQTVANSAIIHSGHDPIEGSLKAILSVKGNALYEELEHELNIPILRTGAFVLAHDEEEEKMLEELKIRANHNGVPTSTILDGDTARKLEPNMSDSVTKVLSLPTTKVTYPWEVAFACLENAMKNGVEFRKNQEVTNITYEKDHFIVETNFKEKIETKNVISASGIFSDHIAHMIEKDVPYTIKPRRGEYYVLDRRVKGYLERILYPLPTAKGKGVLLVPQVHGNILVGPTSVEQLEKVRTNTTPDGMKQIKEDASRLAKNIPFDKTIRTFSGIRAGSTYKDFYIKESKEYKGFFHVAGIDSPGLTAAPAIARYLVDEVIKPNVSPKENYDPKREKKIFFYTLSEEEQKKKIKENPLYGNIVCKCEKITEVEIMEAIHGPLGNDTIKGIKKRARAGSGLCQGGYCENTVLKIIARETDQPLNKINYYGKDTPILWKETKVK